MKSRRTGNALNCLARLALVVALWASPLHSQGENVGTLPKMAPPPPPDPATLIKTVVQNQKQIEAARRDYIARRKDQEFDSQGNLKSTETREYEEYFVGPWLIERLVSKDGKPLSAGETRKQDEDVRKQEAKAHERIAKQDAGEDPGKDTITLTKFLAADRFFNLRRDAFQGREVYAMDFGPRPDFATHSLTDKLLKALGGTLWIDEQASQIVRLDAHFLAGVNVGGGLLGSLQKGGNVVFEQKFVNDEVWMPSYVEIHLTARVVFLHKLFNVVSTFSDYRKFRVDSKITGSPTIPAAKP
jgi:hypothetical protein